MYYSITDKSKIAKLTQYQLNKIKQNGLVENGDELCKLNDDFEYSKFVLLANQLIKRVMDEISEEGIIVYDSHDGNVMYDYDKDKFLLIDQGEWSRNVMNPEDAKVENFFLINQTVFEVLFPKEDFKGFIQYKDDFIDFYESKREEFEKKSGIKIKTIGDSKKYIGVL